VQLTAVQTLSALNRPGVADLLVSRWKDLGPTQRREVLEALFARPERLTSLIKAMETEIIPLTEVDPARRSQLAESKNADLATRAKALFAKLPSLSRADVLKAYASAAKLDGKWDAGETVFKKVCATCHKAGGSDYGADVGPNLQTVISRSPEDLLGHIIEPNREIAPQYLNYSVAMKDGRVLTGMIASESSNSIVLKRAEGVLETVPRAQIEEVRSTGQSLMPEGLENGLKPQDFADLILFIKQIGSR
jgi:putative heme-binding domain-containing protein